MRLERGHLGAIRMRSSRAATRSCPHVNIAFHHQSALEQDICSISARTLFTTHTFRISQHISVQPIRPFHRTKTSKVVILTATTTSNIRQCKKMTGARGFWRSCWHARDFSSSCRVVGRLGSAMLSPICILIMNNFATSKGLAGDVSAQHGGTASWRPVGAMQCEIDQQ